MAPGYGYYRTLTIDYTKVSTATLTSFPMLFSGTYSYLATVANGGNVTSSSGYDIRFEDMNGTKLDHELDSYTASTGAISAWVRIPSLSNAVNTQIRVWYGNPYITTSVEQNITGVWDSSFLGVYHLPTVTGGASTVLDSSANARHGSPGNSPTNATGKIDGAGSFANASTQYVDLGAGINPTAITFSCWVNANSFPNTYNSTIERNNASNTAYTTLYVKNTGKLAVYAFANAGVNYDGTGSATLSTGTWYHLGMSYSSTFGLWAWVNGVNENGGVGPNGNLAGPATTRLATDAFIAGRNFDGIIDEARISSIFRPFGWLETEYNSMSSPSTFYSISEAFPQRGRFLNAGNKPHQFSPGIAR